MRYGSAVSVALAGCLIAVLVGCQPPRALTPRAAIDQYLDSLRDKDEMAFAAVVDLGPGNREVAGALFDLQALEYDLVREYLMAYGPGELARIRDDVSAGASVSLQDREKIAFQAQGDTARATFPSVKAPVRLVRHGKAWSVYPLKKGREPTTSEQRKQLIKVFDIMKDIRLSVLPKIGVSDARGVADSLHHGTSAALVGHIIGEAWGGKKKKE